MEEQAALTYYYSEECQAALKEAGEFKKRYFSQFPGIKQFIADVESVAKKRGWVKTWTGRRRRFADPKKEAYKAVNAIIQGGCGDILKDRLIEVSEFLKDKKSRVVNLVHDEIALEIHNNEWDIIPEISRILGDLDFSVPLYTDFEWSDLSWGEKKKHDELVGWSEPTPGYKDILGGE